VHVAEVFLKESRLTPSGPVHRTLEVFLLSSPTIARD
jgi:2'-5' RNA ligase